MSIQKQLKIALLTISVFCASSCLAQVVSQANHAILQPTIARDEAGFESCGIVANVFQLKDGDTFIETYSFSLTISAKLFEGLLKAGKLINTTADLKANKPQRVAITPAPIKFWIAKENEGQALTTKNIFPAETKGYILGGGDLAKTFSAILATANGEKMQFAIRYKNEPYDKVISFAANLSDQEKNSLLVCLQGVTDRMKAEANSTDSATKP